MTVSQDLLAKLEEQYPGLSGLRGQKEIDDYGGRTGVSAATPLTPPQDLPTNLFSQPEGPVGGIGAPFTPQQQQQQGLAQMAGMAGGFISGITRTVR